MERMFWYPMVGQQNLDGMTNMTRQKTHGVDT
jgi:hypothetical protein